MVLQLQPGVLYGPVRSRRFGPSLGINLSPCDRKLCSFNCVYCHYGVTRRLVTEITEEIEELPTADLVLEVLEAALRSPTHLEVVTFSGNGEATLHPDFPEIASSVAGLVTRWRPRARVVLLSNASGLSRPEVREALSVIDVPVLKLDAGTSESMVAINRPARGIRFEEIVDDLVSIPDLTLQTLLLNGAPCNTTPRELDAYLDLVSLIAPNEVQLYSIDRPVPDDGIERVPEDRLREIASQGQDRTGVPFRVYAA